MLQANWPAPPNVYALTTSREEGLSEGVYAHNNLALHVEDNPEHVLSNRLQLRKTLGLSTEPLWLEQTHSTVCVLAEEEGSRQADAAITRQKNTPLVIMTADCLPIMLCNEAGNEIAAIHAGWKGLAHGIIQNTLDKMQSKRENLLAWIGPAICGKCYEVGEEVKNTFTQYYPRTEDTFITSGNSFLANLPQMAELILNEHGIKKVYQSGACTYESENQFYSYRRGAKTGRIATLVWFS